MSDILSKLLSSHLLRLTQAHLVHVSGTTPDRGNLYGIPVGGGVVSAIDSSVIDYNVTSDLESMECMTPDTEDSNSDSEVKQDQFKTP